MFQVRSFSKANKQVQLRGWLDPGDLICKGCCKLRIPKSKAEVRSADLSLSVTDALPCSSTALALRVGG
ncbi:hypothetical protein AKJ16_DCAP08021 [Drosera capensis]